MSNPTAKLLWYQYSLRTLLIVMLLGSIGLSWITVRIRREQAREEAVAAIRKLGGFVLFEPPMPSETPWLRRVLGNAFWSERTSVLLADTPVTDTDLELLQGVPRLIRLRLENTRITDAGLVRLQGLNELELLCLDDTQITDAGLDHLQGLPQLRYLFLRNTQITDGGLGRLQGLTQLQQLSLNSTQVTDAGLERLGGLPQLRRVYAVNTRVTLEAVLEFQEASPRRFVSIGQDSGDPVSFVWWVGFHRNAVDWLPSPKHEQLVAAAEKSVAEAEKRVAQDRFRPAFHFLPAGRFMNDPNGCVLFRDEYHMFFQHLPFWGEKDAPGAPGWGHAVSPDLVHWKRLPIALMPVPDSYDAAAVASGSCVLTSEWEPTIVYTSVPPQAQSVARSFDGMLTWHRYKGNPVIPKPPDIPGLEDGFRDPFVWCEGGEWRMLVGSGIRGQGGTVLLYESPDLIHWKFLGQLCTDMGPDCFQWECPNFFQAGDYWVLVVSPLLHSIPALRGPVQYTIGRYDGRTFEHGPWYPMDLGGPSVFYAPNSLQDSRARRIQWGWLMGGGEPDSPWNGMLTLPRQVQLWKREMRLHVFPADNVDTLRQESLAELDARELKVGETLEVCRGLEMDVVIEFKRSSPGRLKMEVFGSADGAATTTVTFDPASGELRCGEQSGMVPRGDEELCSMRILVDRSVVEVYADQREVMSLRAYPPVDADRFRLTAENGSLQLHRVQAWRMKSIW